MDTASIDENTPDGKELTKMPSRSRPGRVHFLDTRLRACSCEATATCWHLRVARVRAAKAAGLTFEGVA